MNWGQLFYGLKLYNHGFPHNDIRDIFAYQRLLLENLKRDLFLDNEFPGTQFVHQGFLVNRFEKTVTQFINDLERGTNDLFRNFFRGFVDIYFHPCLSVF